MFKRIFSRVQSRAAREQGQSLSELAIGTVFLMFLVIAIYELGTVYRAYTVLVNATRESVAYASMNPKLADPTSGITPDYSDPVWGPWMQTTLSEFIASDLDSAPLVVVGGLPTLNPSGNMGAFCPITVTLQYKIKTFTSGVSFPWIGRPGLPQDGYVMQYAVGMPIRNPPANSTPCPNNQ